VPTGQILIAERKVEEMSAFRNIIDVLEVAVRIERLGTEFYKKLYESVGAPQAKTVFSMLAAEEEKHLGTFRKMLEEAADYQPRYDYPGEYGLFLNQCAASLLERAERSIAGSPATTEEEALQKGLDFEKESVMYYLELRSEGDFGRKHAHLIDEIIAEEHSHWKKLLMLKYMKS
jgi:rubrerythrin